jgi:PBP1b-binding outer membrane lipoprotein LpoB
VNPASENFARPEVETLYDMKAAVADLVAKMQDDDGFQEHYELLASKKGDRPVLQIGNIENYTTERVAQKLESARRRLEIALRKTRLFDITDDAASAESVSEDVAESITRNANIGLNNCAGLQEFGEHVSADYLMRGRYRAFADGGRHSYELSLQLIDLHNGKQIWSDIADIEKE